jgi:NAD(P)-dependent dehydrogenase (short-subunit alcohol dehydrogenase family)/peroxiredoxin
MFCREQVAQLRERITEIRDRGAELVVIGNGAANFAAAFRDEAGLDVPLLVDPELRAYRAAGLRRGRVEVLSPRLPLNALRAWGSGHRQSWVRGDPWQLGGVFVIRPGGEPAYRYVSREAGDHPPVDEILEALSATAPPVPEVTPEPGWIAPWLGRGLSLLADPTIVFSFSRPGFQLHSLAFDPGDLDVDLDGRRCLVTGANSGLGFETALALADLGAEVRMLCRSVERGEAAATEIREHTGNARVRVAEVDLANLDSVRRVASGLGEDPVDVLIHNAGLLPSERIETPDGLELTFAVHVAGPHLLTKLLRSNLDRSTEGRVVWVSSGGMYTRRLDLDDPRWDKRDYDGVVAYAETKRAQVVLSELWAEELEDQGVVVNAMHPGWADTPGVEQSLPGFYRLASPILRTPAEGADSIVWLAASEAGGARTGGFFLDREPRCTHYLPWTRETDRDRQALWRLCERVTAPQAPSGLRPARGSRAFSDQA